MQPARADDQPVTLAHTYKKNDSFRHKMTVNASVGGMDAVLVRTIKLTVKDIKDNGDVILEETDEGGQLTLNGADQSLPSQPPLTLTRDKTGKLLDYKADDSGGGFMAPEVQKLVAMISDTLFPNKPVKAGDIWQAELDDPVVKDKKVVVKGSFIGVEKVQDKDLWKVKQSAEAPVDADGNKMTMEITMYLDPATGQPVKGEGSVKDLPTTQVGPVSWTMKIEMLKPEADKKDK